MRVKFENLPESAKQQVIDNYREYGFDEWWDAVYEDAVRVGNILGIEFDSKRHHNPAIYFSGFSSQGDGACFEGSYRYAKGAVKAIRAYAPQDEELHRIAAELQKVQSRNFYRLRAYTNHRGHYYHAYCMSVQVEDDSHTYRHLGSAEEDITQLLRDFADWIYRQLEKEYDYLNSEKAISELLEGNEYEIDEEGNIV